MARDSLTLAVSRRTKRKKPETEASLEVQVRRMKCIKWDFYSGCRETETAVIEHYDTSIRVSKMCGKIMLSTQNNYSNTVANRNP